jgi:hypothetical protein
MLEFAIKSKITQKINFISNALKILYFYNRRNTKIVVDIFYIMDEVWISSKVMQAAANRH